MLQSYFPSFQNRGICNSANITNITAIIANVKDSEKNRFFYEKANFDIELQES